MTGLSVEEIQRRAQEGDGKALFQLGYLHENGSGVALNHVLAYAYYLLAEAEGVSKAETSKHAVRIHLSNEQVTDAEKVAEGISWDIEKVGRAKQMKKAADSATISLAGHVSEPLIKAGRLSDVANVTFTFRVHDATAPSRPQSQQWTLTQSVDHLLQEESLDDVHLKAAHLLQRKLRRLADQLDPNLPCRSCSILAAKKK